MNSQLVRFIPEMILLLGSSFSLFVPSKLLRWLVFPILGLSYYFLIQGLSTPIFLASPVDPYGLSITGQTQLFKMLIVLAGVCLMFLRSTKFFSQEHISVLLLSLALSFLLISSTNWLNIFVFSEGISFCTMIFIGLQRPFSEKSFLKYILNAALSAALLLLGISLLFTATHTINLVSPVGNSLFLVNGAILLISVSFFMKLGLIPFHWWIPGVFQGLKDTQIFFISILPKLAFFFLLFSLKQTGYFRLIENQSPFYQLVLLGTIIAAQVLSLRQKHFNKFLGLSSLSHLGFLSIMLFIADVNFLDEAMEYWAIYMVSLSLLLWSLRKKSRQVLAFLALFVLSSFPPSPLFFTKYKIILSLWSNSQWEWAIIIILSSILPVFYYFENGRNRVFSQQQMESSLS